MFGELGDLDAAYDWHGPLSGTELKSTLADIDVGIRSYRAKSSRLLVAGKEPSPRVAQQVSRLERRIQNRERQKCMLIAGERSHGGRVSSPCSCYCSSPCSRYWWTSGGKMK